MFPYDTLKGKADDVVYSELNQIAKATRITVDRGCDWLLGQMSPAGPIMAERSMKRFYKPVWAFGATGRTETLTPLLDWCQENALQPNGDLFFPEEIGPARDAMRFYRAATIMPYAHSSGHPLAENPVVRQRMHQYLDSTSGSVYSFIGEDPDNPEFPDTSNVMLPTFFGEYAIAADSREAAVAAGKWLMSLIEQNDAFMSEQGLFYWTTRGDGTVVTEVGAGEEYNKVLTNRPTVQANYPGWVMGCCIAFLADLYDAHVTQWGASASEAAPYLDAARKLARYEASMPLETYFFPSKCKVAWGAGRLLSVLLAHQPDDEDAIDDAYRIGKRTYLYTFLGNRHADGSWGAEFYPHSDESPEMVYDYRIMEGLSALPVEDTQTSATAAVLSAIEITAENAAELHYFADGVNQLFEVIAEKQAGKSDGAKAETKVPQAAGVYAS